MEPAPKEEDRRINLIRATIEEDYLEMCFYPILSIASGQSGVFISSLEQLSMLAPS